MPIADDGAVHEFFGLTYSNALVLHRSILQSMPLDWQERFVAVMNELDNAIGEGMRKRIAASYSITPRSANGKFTRDAIPHYWRGRTRLDLQTGEILVGRGPL